MTEERALPSIDADFLRRLQLSADLPLEQAVPLWYLWDIGDLLQDVWNWLTYDLWWGIEGLWGGIEALWDGVGDIWSWVEDIYNRVGAWLGDAGRAIGDFLGDVGTRVGDWLGDAGSTIGDFLGDVGTRVGDWLGDAGSTIGDFLGDVGTRVGDWLGDAGSTIGDFLGDVGTRVGDWLGNAGETVGTWLGNAGDWLSQRWIDFSGLLEGSRRIELESEYQAMGIPYHIDPAGDPVPDDTSTNLTILGVGDFLSGIINGIWTGLGSAFGALMDATGAFISGIDLSALQGFTGFIGDAYEGLMSTIMTPLLDLLLPGTTTGAMAMTTELLGSGAGATDPARQLLARIANTTAAAVAALGVMTVAGELIHPLKEMGLGHISSMLWSASNYGTIMSAVVGTIAGVNLVQPLRYALNSVYTPYFIREGDLTKLRMRRDLTSDDYFAYMRYQGYDDGQAELLYDADRALPPIPDLTMMRAKKEISETLFDTWMGRYGIREEYLKVYHEHLWLDPRLGELVRIGQFYRPGGDCPSDIRQWLVNAGLPLPADQEDNWWFYYKAAKGGYEPVDVPMIANTAKLAVARREQTLWFDAARRLRRDGYIDNARLTDIVNDGWRPRSPTAFRLEATALDVEYEEKAELTDTINYAYARGIISEAEAIGYFGDIGVDPFRVQILITRTRLGMAPRRRMELPAEEEEAISYGE